MTLSQMLLPEYDQEFANARKILAVVPEDKFGWKPHDKSMTLGRLASHVAETGHWADVTIHTDKLELTPGQKPFRGTSGRVRQEHRCGPCRHRGRQRRDPGRHVVAGLWRPDDV